MRPTGKRLCVAVLVAIFAGTLVWFLSSEPFYRGRPVSQWAVDYSRTLYPSGTAPLSPSQKGLEALRKMGPQKAAIALVHALMRQDSEFYQLYRTIYPRLPGWYQNRFPPRLTYQQRVTLVLGATEFFDLEYQKAMIPFLIHYLEDRDVLTQIAACQLLANMPEAGSPALPALKRLTNSPEPSVCQAAQAAIARIGH